MRDSWWESTPGEDIFMEITRRRDIGADLHAPKLGRGGSVPGGYALVPMVRPGNVIVHYDSRAEALVGVSVALGDAEARAVYWAPRGRSARDAGIKPSWQQGLAVPLGGYRALVPAISFDDLQAHGKEILRLRSDLASRYGGSVSLHYPWYEYGLGGRLRAQQAYLVKMPLALARLFPSLQSEIDALRAEWHTAVGKPMSEVDEASERIQKGSGRTPGSSRRRSLRAGYLMDAEARVAIEVRAMNVAMEHYSRNWKVEDVHGHESYDLVCRRGKLEMHVEVKGTTGDGARILLTRNEVIHAQSYPSVSLFVLVGIDLERYADGTVRTAAGGNPVIFDPWVVESGTLLPVGYDYTLPPRPH